MAQDWRALGEIAFPDEQFATAWDVYQHAAQLTVDRVIEVQLTIAPSAPNGIASSEVSDWLDRTEVGAADAARAHMAFCLGAAAFLEDLKKYGRGRALPELLEEANPNVFQ